MPSHSRSVAASRLLRIEHIQDDLDAFNALLDKRTNDACREIEQDQKEVVARIKRETHTVERLPETYIIGFAPIFSFTPDEEYQEEEPAEDKADPYDTRPRPRPYLPFPAEPRYLTDGLLEDYL